MASGCHKPLVEHGVGTHAEPVRSHLFFGEAQTTERRIQRVFRHGTEDRADRGKDKGAMAGELLHVLVNGNGLLGQRHPVGTAHLHPRFRSGPNPLVQIELGPVGRSQLTRPREEQGQELQRGCRRGLTLEAIDCPKERPEGFGSVKAAQDFLCGAVRAPRSAKVGSVSARAVATA